MVMMVANGLGWGDAEMEERVEAQTSGDKAKGGMKDSECQRRGDNWQWL